MARARCGIGCEYTVYSGYLPWSFISLLPCSILSSRNPSPARFLPPAVHATPRSFLACSNHQPSLPQPSLPPLTLRSCVASLLPLSLPLLSPSLPLFPLPPSPCSQFVLKEFHHATDIRRQSPRTERQCNLPPSFLLSLPPLVPSHTITLLPPPPSFPPSVPPTFYSPALLPCPSLPACLLSCNSIYTVCVYTVLASCTGYCLGRAQPWMALRQICW